MPLYLGLDVRTESLTATVIEIASTRRIAFQHSIPVDSPEMWDEALERMMARLAVAGELDLDDLRACSGSAAPSLSPGVLPQAVLLALHPSRALAPQLRAIVPEDDLRAMREAPLVYFPRLLAAPYWQLRYSLPPLRLVPWDTTHASALIGAGIIRRGLMVIALGPTDTVADVDAVLTFRNGSLARDWIRLEYGLDAPAFAALLEQRPGNDGYLMLPWLEDEITPNVTHRGIRRFGFDRLDAGRNVRGLVEGQLMAMANHAADLIGKATDRIIVTGVEAANHALLQVIANVFAVDVYWLEVGNTAALGAALRAYQAERLDSGEPVSWSTVVSVLTEPNPGHRVSPNPRHAAMYAELRREYRILEHVHKDRRPIC